MGHTPNGIPHKGGLKSEWGRAKEETRECKNRANPPVEPCVPRMAAMQ